ncbi:MAG: hypothetical protein J1E40_01815 [Oscillospiraceae bacterium]|nr:hypothetical protein [Oscillospiraceae bacterium]
MDTYAQYSIKHCLDMLAPFESTDTEIQEGQQQFYRFITSIYQGMYEAPEKYMVFPEPYEKYIQKRQINKKEKEHSTDSRESTLRNTFQQAIQFYAIYFYHLGSYSSGIDEKSGSLIISDKDYSDVLYCMSRIHQSEYNEKRYEVLADMGIEVIRNENIVEISHKTYKQMMRGLLYLCKAPDSKYKLMNYLRLDYKNAYAPIPAVADICKTLPEQNAEIVKMLEKHLSGLKVKAKIRPLRGIVSDFRWKVEYSYKGKNICGFYADNKYFMLCIYFNDFRNINAFSKTLYEEDIELFKWFKNQFPERLCKCKSNRRVDFGDETRRICGLSNRAEIVNPNADDVKNALHILKKYRNINHN